MSFRKFFSTIIAVFVFQFVTFAQIESSDKKTSSVSPNDETAIKSVVTQYFNAYLKKDVFDITSRWNTKSQYFAPYKQDIEKMFAKTESIELKTLSFGKITVEGEKAKVRAVVEFNAAEVKTGKPYEVYESKNRVVILIREDNSWKIFRHISAEKDLAIRLIEIKSTDERNQLLNEEKDLVNVSFAQEFYRECAGVSERIPFSEELDNFNLGLKIAEQIGDKKIIASFLGRIGKSYAIRGNTIKGLEYYQKALVLREQIGEAEGISISLSNIGIINTEQANYAQALENFEKSVKLSESIGDKGGMAIDLYNIGNVYRAKGDYANAMIFYQKSLSLSAEIGSPEGIVGAVYENISGVNNAQRNYEQAIEYLNKALTIFEKSESKYGIYLALGGLGGSYQLQGQYLKSIEFYQKSLVLKQEFGDKPGVAGNLTQIGESYNLLGDNSKASEHFQKALDLYELLARDSGVFADQMVDVLLSIAKMQFSQEKFTEAQKTIERAKSYYEKSPELRERWELYAILGQINRRMNQPQQARRSIDKSIEIIEKQRLAIAGGEEEQQRFFADKVSAYHLIVDFLVSQNNPHEAFSYSERAKSRTLLDVLQNGKIDYTKAMTTQEKEQERRLKNELVSLNAQISKENERLKNSQSLLSDLQNQLEKKRLEFEDFQTRLYASHPDLKVQRGEMKPVSLEESARLLPDNQSALLEYVVAEGKAFLFVLTKLGKQSAVSLKVYPIEIKQKDLAERTESFRSKLAKGDLDFSKQAQDLYDLLLKPAEAQIKNKTNLIIVPDSVLWDLPFQALQPAQNKYLIENSAISYAPSLSALREMMKKNQGKQFSGATLLAFGNPAVNKETSDKIKTVFMDKNLEPLPEAERLVTSLGKLYGANRSEIFIGANAREEIAKTESSKYRIVQFAAHGILNDINPMYSHIVLSQKADNPNEDGLLEAWEMKDLSLNADMVILSACETARGRFSSGEGVIGMSWALFIAGAPTTVASQWRVESSSTTELMLEFHRQLLTGKNISKAEALRKASLKLLKNNQYKHPSYWAGFVIVGDGS